MQHWGLRIVPFMVNLGDGGKHGVYDTEAK